MERVMGILNILNKI